MQFRRYDPITVPKVIYNRLPKEFVVYNDKKHKEHVPTDLKPILVKMPTQLIHVLACIKVIDRLRQWYPAHAIELQIEPRYNILFQGKPNITTIRTYNVNPGQYFKQISTKYWNNSPAFSLNATRIHTLEFCYLNHLNLLDNDNPKTPSQYTNEGTKHHLTILNFGETKNTVWGELGTYLAKQQWHLPIRLVDKEPDVETALDILSTTKQLLVMGDTQLSVLAAYYGIPMFLFTKEPKSLLISQLDLFNNVKLNRFYWSEFVRHIEYKIIYERLYKLLESINKNKAIQKPIKTERVTLPKKQQPRINHHERTG